MSAFGLALDGHGVAAMGDLQVTLRREITFRVMRKHDDAVADVVLHRVNVPVGRVNPNTAVKLHVRLCTRNHTLRFGTRSASRRVVEAAEYPDAPCVAILKEDFVEPHVDP